MAHHKLCDEPLSWRSRCWQVFSLRPQHNRSTHSLHESAQLAARNKWWSTADQLRRSTAVGHRAVRTSCERGDDSPSRSEGLEACLRQEALPAETRRNTAMDSLDVSTPTDLSDRVRAARSHASTSGHASRCCRTDTLSWSRAHCAAARRLRRLLTDTP